MVNSTQNNTKANNEKRSRRNTYVPDSLEASLLREVGKPWRYYKNEEEFKDVLSELEKQTVMANGEEISVLLAGRANAVIRLGAQMSEYSSENIENAEKQIRSDKKLWDKLQAILLYNSLNFKPELTDPQKFTDAKEIQQLINDNMKNLQHGKFENGEYIPSKAEKNVLETLRNYGIFIRNPQNEQGIERYLSNMSNRLNKVFRRNDYREVEEKNPKSKRKEKDMTENSDNTFQLDDEQLKLCRDLGINPDDIKNIDEYNDAIKNKSAQSEKKETPKEEVKEETPKEEVKEETPKEEVKEETPKEEAKEEEKEEAPKEKAKEALRVTVSKEENRENTPENTPQADAEWIQRKIQYYESLSSQGKISEYSQDKEVQGFSAKFNKSHIHYTDPNNVSISPDADYKVFDAMFKEPDNIGRPIEFPENMGKEMATKMYVACIMNGNPMQGSLPKELDEKALSECGLSAENIQKIKANFAKMQQQQNKGDTTKAPTMTAQEKAQKVIDDCARLGMAPEKHVIKFSNGQSQEFSPSENVKELTGEERTKFIESLSAQDLNNLVHIARPKNEEQKQLLHDLTKKVINNNVSKIKDIRKEFDNMKSQELINIEKDENGKSHIVAGAKGSNKDVAKAKELISSAENLHTQSQKLNTANDKQSNMEIRQEQLDMKKAQMTPEEISNHQRLKELRDTITAKRLGLIDGQVQDAKGNEVATKQGEDLSKLKSNLSKETMDRLTNKFSNHER